MSDLDELLRRNCHLRQATRTARLELAAAYGDDADMAELERDWPQMPEHLDGVDRFAHLPIEGAP